LEAFTTFETKADAELYAESELAYFGQYITVKDGDSYKGFIVQENRKLSSVADLSVLSKYVKGPESAVTVNSVPVFSATNGKSIKGSKITISDDG
jgi:hypothetical protein